MSMDAQTFSRNLKKILGLPEREKHTQAERFAPRILSQTGSVVIGGADEFVAPIEVPEEEPLPEPDTWILPDFCNLYLPDDESGQCYCLRAHNDEPYPCPEYTKSISHTRDDWVNQVEQYIAATFRYRYRKNDDTLLDVGYQGGRLRVVGWSAIVAHIDRFAESVGHKGFDTTLVKSLMQNMRDFKPVIPQMENSDGFVAGFLESDQGSKQGAEGAEHWRYGHQHEWTFSVSWFGLTFKLRRYDDDFLLAESADFDLQFEVVDVPRLPSIVNLEPPIVPECIALRVANTGFYAACANDKRLPEKFKKQAHHNLSMLDEYGNTVLLSSTSDWGMTVIYRGWLITLDRDFVPTDAVRYGTAQPVSENPVDDGTVEIKDVE